jgi:hypothetical protein
MVIQGGRRWISKCARFGIRHLVANWFRPTMLTIESDGGHSSSGSRSSVFVPSDMPKSGSLSLNGSGSGSYLDSRSRTPTGSHTGSYTGSGSYSGSGSYPLVTRGSGMLILSRL